MPKEPIRAPLGVNVPGLTMAGFQLTLHGRIWVIPEVRGTRHQTTGWQLADETPAGTTLPEGELEFPLNINLQDAMGNILKMRLHFAIDGASKGHLDRTSFRLHVFRFACLVSTAS